MKAIRSSKFFPVLTALCLLLTSVVWAGELLTAIGVAGAIASILGLLAWSIQQLHEAIKTKEQKLASREKELSEAESQRDANIETNKNWERLIPRYDTLISQAETMLETATQEYEAAKTAYDDAKTEFQQKSDAYKQAKKAYDDHVDDCYYSQTNQFCSIESRLSYQKSQAQEELRKAKVSRTFAKSTYNSKKSDKAKAERLVKKYTRRQNEYKTAKDNLAESHATLLATIRTLNAQILQKKIEIAAAKMDLSTEEGAQSEAQAYQNRFKSASTQGLDMEQWVKDNPIPESLAPYMP